MRTQLYSLVLALFMALNAQAQLRAYAAASYIHQAEKAGYYTLHIPAGILSQSESGFSDFRIYEIADKDTIEVPYVENIFTHTGYVEAPAEALFNRSKDARGNQYISFRNKAQRLSNLELETDATEFDNNIALEGSQDNRHWFRFVDSSRIVGYRTGTGEYRHYTGVEFSPVNFAYIRIVSYGNAHYKAPKINVVRLNVKQYERWRQPEALKSEIKQEEGPAHHSQWRISLPQRFYVQGIRFHFPGKKDYYREYAVYTQHLDQHAQLRWTYRGNGILSSEQRDNSYEFSPLSQSLIAGAWYGDSYTDQIRIVVNNLNDQPLAMPQVEVFGETADLIAYFEPGKTYELAYGRKNDQAPQYDLAHFKNKLPSALPELRLGFPVLKGSGIPERKEPLFRSNYWIWIAMGASILLIGIFALRLLKSEKRQ